MNAPNPTTDDEPRPRDDAFDPRAPAHAASSGDALRIESPGVAYDRRRVARLASLALVVTYLGTCAHAVSAGHSLALFWMIVAPVAMFLVWGALFAPRRRPGALSLDARGLVVERAGRASYYPPDAIEGGIVVPGAARPQLELLLRGNTVLAAEVDSLGTAEAFLAAAGLDPSRRRFELGAPAFGLRALGGVSGGLIAAIFGLFFVASLQPYVPPAFLALVWLAVVGGAAAATARAVSPPVVTVGSDGLVVRAAWSTRFVPYAQLDGVEERHDDIYLRFRDGHSEVLRSTWLALDPAHRAALALRVRDAMSAGGGPTALGHGGGGGAVMAAALARGGRAVREWRAGLAQLFDRATGYRAAPITRDEVARVLAEPRSTPEQRIAAALALRTCGDADARARIRVAVDACASEPLRAALSKVERDELDDATLEAALRGTHSTK